MNTLPQSLVLLVFTLLVLIVAAASQNKLQWRGASMQADPQDASLAALQQANGNCMRIYAHWRYVQPRITYGTVDFNLRVEDLRKLYAKNISALDAWSKAELKWVCSHIILKCECCC